MTAVVVPVYNGAHVLPETVPAVLRLAHVDEWIWVDDGSTDDTQAVLRALTSAAVRARVVSLSENQGRGAARNAGVASTDATRILFLDADVTPEPPFAELTLKALAQPGAVAAVGTFRPVVEDPTEPYAVYLRTARRGAHGAGGERVPWKTFLTAAVGVDRGAFDRAGGFDPAIPYGEDIELAARLSLDHPDGLVASGAHVQIQDVDPLDGALARISTFGRALPAIVAKTPAVATMSGLARLLRPSAARTVARSSLLAVLARAALPFLPGRGVALGVRYLLAHALARAIADAQSRSR